MKHFDKWKHLHDEIANSPEVSKHRNNYRAALILRPDEAEKHRQAYVKAFHEHPKAAEYKELSKKL